MRLSSLLAFITPHRGVLYSILGLLLVSSFFSLFNPWIAGQFTTLLIHNEGAYFTDIKMLLIAWLVIMLLTNLLSFCTRYLIGATGETITAKLRSHLYGHIQLLSLSYHQSQDPGKLLTVISNDAEVISRFVTGTLVQLLPLFVTLIGAFFMMITIEPGLAVLAICLLPLYFFVMKLVGRQIRPLTRKWIDTYSEMFSLVKENLGLIPAIKAFTRESHEASRFEHKNTLLLRVSRKQLFAQSLLAPTISFLAGAGMLLLLWLASEKLLAGQMTAGDLVSLLLYAVLLTRPISGLADVYGQVQRTRGAAERILELLAVQNEPLDEGKPFPNTIDGHIRFENITFSYPERPVVLQGLNLDIQAGETIAIVGENGAGKSTLVHLLMRLVEANQGRILIDGFDIRKISRKSLRSQIGLVAQHTLLLNGSFSENIAYGSPMISQGEIEKAARDAHIHDLICELPKGYETVIGEQGLQLSGGQRQRLSLARTLLKKSPILVLDEATSMLDPKGEQNFIHEFLPLLNQRTVILITHRPASLALADRILELKDGRFKEILPANIAHPHLSPAQG